MRERAAIRTGHDKSDSNGKSDADSDADSNGKSDADSDADSNGKSDADDKPYISTGREPYAYAHSKWIGRFAYVF